MSLAALIGRMSIIDLLIIYLTLGAPFGAYALIRSNRINVRTVGSVLVALTAWPVYGSLLAVSSERGARQRLRTGAENEEEIVQAVRYRVDSLKSTLSTADRKRTRPLIAAIEAYAEISLLALTQNDSRSGHATELLCVSGREDTVIGSKCIQRRNLAKARMHHKKARQSLLKEIDLWVEELNAFPEPIIELARLLNDREMQEIVTNSRAKNNKGIENLEWSEPKQQNAAAIT